MKTLCCENPQSALISISEILELPQVELLGKIHSILDQDIWSSDRTAKVEQCFDLNVDEFQAMWFHGTRLLDVRSILEKGILPKAEIYPTLELELLRMGGDIPFTSSESLRSSIALKASFNDEGPYAYLFKENFLVTEGMGGTNNNYATCPEGIEDISFSIAGGNMHHLIERYRKVSRPYVVAFCGPANRSTLVSAILYLCAFYDDGDSIGHTVSYNSVINRAGLAVSPEEIIYIDEVIESRTFKRVDMKFPS